MRPHPSILPYKVTKIPPDLQEFARIYVEGFWRYIYTIFLFVDVFGVK